MGRLGQIGSIRTPVKFLLWALNLKNRPMKLFKVPIIKAEKRFWRAFPNLAKWCDRL